MTQSTPFYCELDLRFRDLVVRARSADRSDLEWLAEFLTPQFSEVSEAQVSRQVTLERDESRLGLLSEAGPLDGHEPVGCFAFDNSLLRLTAWNSLDESRVIFDDKHHVFYLISPDGSNVTILAHSKARSGRIPFMRIVREWAMSHGMQAGGLFLHASAFAVADRGVVLAGEKSAGKTSLLVHALRHPKTAYLSNDRVLVSMEESATRVTGMPTIATIRSAMLPLFPGLVDRLPTARYAHHRRVASAFPPGEPMKPWGDGRYGLTPAQFTRVLNTASTPEADAAAIVFPKVTGRPGGLRLYPVETARALENLQDAVFGVGAWSELGEVFVAPAGERPAPRPDPMSLCEHLVERLPTLEAELGLEAFADPGTVDSLIEGVLRAPGAAR